MISLEIERIAARGKRLAGAADALRVEVEALGRRGATPAERSTALAAYRQLCADLAVLAALVERELHKHAHEAPAQAASLRADLERVWSMLAKQPALAGGA